MSSAWADVAAAITVASVVVHRVGDGRRGGDPGLGRDLGCPLSVGVGQDDLVDAGRVAQKPCVESADTSGADQRDPHRMAA